MENSGLTLEKVHFRNFRALRDVKLDFSTDPDKPFTVIRAENESGKTTMLRALVWAFFGDRALPAARSDFQISPMDWDVKSDGVEIPIEVELHFEGSGTKFILTRSCSETQGPSSDGKSKTFTPSKSQLSLMQQSANGDWKSLSNPEVTLDSQVPSSVKDVFFIDGDKALSWIESNDARAVKRHRIEDALRSLLGLDLVENAESHVEQAKAVIVKQISKAGGGKELEGLNDKAERLVKEIGEINENLVELEADKKAFEMSTETAEKAVLSALKAGGGNKEELEKALVDNRKLAKRLESLIQENTRQHRTHLEDPGMPACLVSGSLAKATELLGELERSGDIPDTLPHIIQDRLAKGRCICGEELHEGSEKHEFLKNALTDSERNHDSVGILTALNTSLQGAQTHNIAGIWNKRLYESHSQIVARKEELDGANVQYRELQKQVEKIPDSDLAELRKNEKKQRGLLDEVRLQHAKLTERQRGLKEVHAAVDKEITELGKGVEKLRKQMASKTAAEDIASVLTDTLDQLKQVKLKEVSKEMNDLFLAMIGAGDASDRPAAIQSAELTDEHDIVVFGADNTMLDPDIDLNGASRRALTLAFILALVNVSGEKAPNIVDTPLGMTSGGVRFDFMQQVLKYSHQSIMFLTRDEIYGVEALIDKHAGRQLTVTAAWHYPEYLANYPGTDLIESIRCDCDIRSTCPVCERKSSRELEDA